MAVVIDGKTFLTYSDYVHFPEDGRRHELIGGVHHVTPSPITKHQRVSQWLASALFSQIELADLGFVLSAPMDVVLSDTDIVQPDILVVRKENRLRITPKNVQGPPDLVIEITSPMSEKVDLELKKSLYQAHGVPEYWIVLTDEDAVERYVLEGGAYLLAGRHRDRIEYGGIPDVAIDLAEVWRAVS